MGYWVSAVATMLLVGQTGLALAQADQAGGSSNAAGPTASAPNASNYFIDLKDGARVPPTFHVRMGLLNMGVAPAGVDFPMTGHHHLLVDAPLPPLDQPIPADDNHIHLGRGQTEFDVTLAPGPHTLQLLLGDRDHVPHNPPVYSKVIHVTVAVPLTPSRPGAEVYFVSPRDGEIVGPTTTVRFGLHGMGVAPAGVVRSGTGHHHLLVDTPLSSPDEPIPADDQHMHFGNGQTETDLTLSPGKHTLQLELGDEKHMGFDPPVVSKPITVTVRDKKAGP